MSALKRLAADAERRIGNEVVSARATGDSGRVFELRFAEPGDRGVIVIPAPWTFSSCLLASSSDSIEPGTEIDQQLLGLIGARLTAVETGKKSIDLVFDSIRISVFADR